MKHYKTLLANKLFAVLVAVLLLMLIAPAARAQSFEETAQLRTKVEVFGDIVTLGDLFENAGSRARVPVFRAPGLGSYGVISIKRVAAAARQHKLIWRQAQNSAGTPRRTSITVSRPARTIPLKRIKAIIRQEIVRQMPDLAPDNLTIKLSPAARPLLLEARMTPEPVVEELNFTRTSGRFSAVLRVMGANSASSEYIFKGQTEETVKIAVPRANIERGKTITRSDLTFIRVPKNRVRRQTARTMSDLVGLAPTRVLRGAQQVSLKDLERPRLVRKNTLVTIVYAIPGLRLQAQGKANEDGGLGEVISIINLQSRRTIHAVVSAPGRVTIQPRARVAPKRSPATKPNAAQRLSLLTGN